MARIDQAINTKAKILEAARELSIKDGFENLTIRDVCNKVGISIGAFYHHFKSKEELMNESFMIYDETLALNLTSYSDEEPLKSLKSILMDQTQFVSNIPEKLIIEYYKAILSSVPKNAVNTERTYYKSVFYYVGKVQEEGIFSSKYSIEYITEFLIKFVRGNIIDWCLHDFEYDVLERTGDELDLLFKLFIEE